MIGIVTEFPARNRTLRLGHLVSGIRKDNPWLVVGSTRQEQRNPSIIGKVVDHLPVPLDYKIQGYDLVAIVTRRNRNVYDICIEYPIQIRGGTKPDSFLHLHTH